MNMKKMYILFILIVLTSIGCGKDNVKPSADSLLTAKTFDIIDTIKIAYEEKKEYVLKDHLSTQLAKNTAKNLLFEKAELAFNPRFVRISDSEVKVNLNWKGSWWITEDGKIDSRGVANLVFYRETMKLIYIDGDNPFQTPSFR
jgi:hypothetical protein